MVKVFVIGLNGLGLMPTTPRKARLLLKEGKARVVRKAPFTIQLTYKTGPAVQDVSVGIDTGAGTIGVAVASGNKVLYKGEIKLRSSKEKRKLIELRSTLRRSRRYRNTRYRHPKWKAHTVRRWSETPDKKGRHWKKISTSNSSPRPDGWTPPSIRSKIDHHIDWINRFMTALPPSASLRIEIARFDIAKIKHPDWEGEDYQRGPLYEHENTRSYVLSKFGYRCVVCGHKFDNDHKLRMHHIHMRKNGASDNPDEFAPVCHNCHTPENHKKGKPLYELMKKLERTEYKSQTFMNVLSNRIREAFPNASFTYGNFTAVDRNSLGLEKTHANDAVAIAIGTRFDFVTDIDEVMCFKQVRRKRRNLHEANPRRGIKKPNTTAKRNIKNVKSVKGFSIWDEVSYQGKRGYISGFTKTAARVVDFDGEYIRPEGKTYTQIQLSRLNLIQKRTNNYVQKTERRIPPHLY